MKYLLLLLFMVGCQTSQVGTNNSYLSLSWENTTAAHPERASWSQTVSQMVDQNLTDFEKASDLIDFCPKYISLDKQKKIKAISELIVGVVYYESGYSPVSRMKEDLGIDKVTGVQVQSEGLLQLSYGDQQWAPFCKFDWPKDKLLSPTDPKKTILDPIINLECGIKIFSNQVALRKLITTTNNYWAVIKTGHRYQKISSIKAMVAKNAPFCK